MTDFRKFPSFLLVISLVLFLSACQTLKDIRNQRIAERAAADNADCLAKGFTVNTDAFRLCLDNRAIERRVKAAEWEAWEANQNANQARQGATQSCILSGGIMSGDTCLK